MRGVAFRLPPVRLRAQGVRALLTAGAAGGVVLLHGFAPPPLPPWLIVLAQLLLLAGYYADVVYRQRAGREPIPEQRFDWIDTLILIAIGTGLLASVIYSTVMAAGPFQRPWIVGELGIVWLFITEMWRLNVAFSRRLRRPGLLFPLSFIFMIVVGTLLIKMPIATPADRHLSWLDALFTMTSAVCVTGLVVRDTSADFTPLGQTIIAIFIQLGAIGFILFGSMVALLLGQRFSLRGNMDMSQMLQGQSVDRLQRFVRFILITIIIVEISGALAMYPLWNHEEGLTPLRRLGLSLFHTISAFCNAGFDITGESMIPYRYSALSQVVIATLVTIGGIGFPVIANIAGVVRIRIRRMYQRRSRLGLASPVPALADQRLTLHTRLVILTTIGLNLVGMTAVGMGQAAFWVHASTAAPAPLAAQAAIMEPEVHVGLARGALDALFMSITARTAGFTTVPMEEIQPAGRFALICLMFIGGSPGGSAGGVKTTVFAVLVISVISTLRQRRETEIFGRTISDSLVRQAGTVAICYAMLIVIVTLLLSLSERAVFGDLLFEAVSAATTTGLSLGITPELTSFGKVIIIVTMYLGRIGPLALFAALALRRSQQRPYAYPHESVALG